MGDLRIFDDSEPEMINDPETQCIKNGLSFTDSELMLLIIMLIIYR